MAGDWIKMRSDLYRDPKVCVIADSLLSAEGDLARHVSQNCQRDMTLTRNVMRNAVVGCLVTVWGVMRLRGKASGADLFCRGVTIPVLDDIADLPGFGEAMESVGWALQTDDGVVFPRFFDEHNVDPEETARAKNAERQKRFRERHSVTVDNVTSNVTITSREEKRREDITPIPPGFASFWQTYPAARRVGKGKCLKAWGVQALEARAEAIVGHVEGMKRTFQWVKDGGQFVPTTLTYLNQRRYDDDVPVRESGPLKVAI